LINSRTFTIPTLTSVKSLESFEKPSKAIQLSLISSADELLLWYTLAISDEKKRYSNLVPIFGLAYLLGTH
jgi:hypothetical protein